MVKRYNWLAILLILAFILGMLPAGNPPAYAGAGKPVQTIEVQNTEVTDVNENHRVVRGYSETAVSPNFFENDWTAWADEDTNPKSLTTGAGERFGSLTADEQDYLKTVTGLEARTQYFIDLTGQTVSDSRFEDTTDEEVTGQEEKNEVQDLELQVIITHTVTTYKTVTHTSFTVVHSIYGGGSASGDKDIITFSLPDQTGPADIDADAHTVDITVPAGTDVTSLVPTFTLSEGASAAVGGINQESGVTANDFTDPLTYTVKAADDSTQDWTVTVTVAAAVPTTYTLILITNPAAGGTAVDNTDSGPYQEGDKVNVTAEADSGYEFANWTVEGTVVSTSATFDYTMPAGNVTLVANFDVYTPGGNSDGYDDHDFNKLQGFLNQPSAVAGKTNGQRINAAYDPNDPTTWTGVAWNSDSPKRVITIGESDTWGSKSLAGPLDLSGFSCLTSLRCYFNKLTGLDVSGDAALTYCASTTNPLGSLNLSGATALVNLSCTENKLASLDVSEAAGLKYLYCGDNQLTTLDVSHNPELINLNCFKNQLTELDISTNTKLQQFLCQDNRLTSLDVSHAPALRILECNDNKIPQMDLRTNKELQYVNCYNNQLTALDIGTNRSIYSIYCFNNQLSSLDVSGTAALLYLQCQSNQLTSLTVDNALQTLDCGSNQLGALDLHADTALTSLTCNVNQLAALDLKNNSALQYLNCEANQLTSLNVSGAAPLQSLNCYDNRLASLDVSSNKSLITLYCGNNRLTLIKANMFGHSVSLSANGSGYVGLMVGPEKDAVAYPHSGAVFVNWTESGAPVSDEAAYPLNLSQRDYDLVANFRTDDDTPAAPTISPPGGTYPDSVVVTITGSSGQIYYTTDGSDPTSSGTKIQYLGSFTLTSSATVKAAIHGSNSGWSSIALVGYTITHSPTPPPAISPSGDTYPDSVEVTITGSGGTIYYTIDGGDPRTSGIVYSGPFTLTSSATVRAVVQGESGWSEVVSETYTISSLETPVPEFVPNGGPFSGSVKVKINRIGGDSQVTGFYIIFYTTDGSDPKDSGSVYAGEITLTQTTTVKARIRIAELVLDSADAGGGGPNPEQYTWSEIVSATFTKNSSGGGGGGGGGSSQPPSTPETVGPPVEPEVTAPTAAEPIDLKGHWSHDCVMALLKHGIIKGYPDGTIRPENEITRAEAAALLVSALGLQDYQPSMASPYQDELPAWARQAILTATEKKLMKGYPDGTFQPDRKITRAEMCAALMQAFPKTTPTGFRLDFSDAESIPEWARPFVEAAVSNGVVSGYPDSTFQPGNNIKRGEAFSIICRLKGFHGLEHK